MQKQTKRRLGGYESIVGVLAADSGELEQGRKGQDSGPENWIRWLDVQSFCMLNRGTVREHRDHTGIQIDLAVCGVGTREGRVSTGLFLPFIWCFRCPLPHCFSYFPCFPTSISC